MVLPVAGQNTSPFTDNLRRNKSCDRCSAITDLKVPWLKITCSVCSNNRQLFTSGPKGAAYIEKLSDLLLGQVVSWHPTVTAALARNEFLFLQDLHKFSPTTRN